MDNNNLRDLIEEDRQTKKAFLKTQAEKNFYLGEYKERILGALTKDQLLEDDVYPEIIELMQRKEAFLLKLSRDIELKKLKPYIQQAEKIGLNNELVDGLSYKGNIGLVVVSKDAIDNQPENIIIRDMDQDFIDVGLGEVFSKQRGSHICEKHYKMVEKELPIYKEDFKKINFLGKLIGQKCPICEAEQKHRRK